MITRVPVLLYHSIADDAAPRFRRWAVRPRTFAAQMAHLHAHGYTPITVTQFTASMSDGGRPLPRRPVVITFDDGLGDFYMHALPVLREYGFAATLYVVAGFVGGTSRWLSHAGEGARPMLTWEQLAEVAAGGVECGAHSLSHPQLDTLSRAGARDEIARSGWLLEQRLGRRIATFAYPHGYYSAAVRRLVAEAGYSSACAVKHAMSATCDDRFALSRLIVTESEDGGTAVFARLLDGHGLRVAPVRARARTIGWRLARRARAHLERPPRGAWGSAGEEAGPREAEDTGAAPTQDARSAPRLSTGRGATLTQARVAVHAGAPLDGRGAPPARQTPLLVHDLLNGPETLARLLLGELRRGAWLNAYLLAAGIEQIVGDYLHPDPLFLDRAAGYLRQLPPPAGPIAAGSTRALAMVLAGASELDPAARHVARRQAEVAALARRLAELVVGPARRATASEELVGAGEALHAALGDCPPPLLRQVIRIPSCFRSFDQQPADLERIVQTFARHWPDRRRPLVVVGVRTSGSYLAPLYAALLTRAGYRRVQVLTLRPGRLLLRAERALLRAANRRGALVLLVDDPPASGDTLAKTARALERIGVPRTAIILLLQLFGGGETAPASLRRYAAVYLPWEQWTIHEQLRPERIAARLHDLIAPHGEIHAIEPLPVRAQSTPRGHARGLYRVQVAERAGGPRREQRVLVEGAGLGYFGAHALAIARALRPFLPAVYGVRSGLLYRAWVPEARALRAVDPAATEQTVDALVAYILARRHALAVDEDTSARLTGRLPVWEVASNLLSQAFGRGWLLVRLPVIDPLVTRMLRCRQPSVIDGSMTPAHCFIDDGRDTRLIKVDFAERAFTHRELTCYDAAFDLACLAASIDLEGGYDAALPRRLRATYERCVGEPIGEERWLLYQLVHFWDRQRLHGDQGALRRARARALQRYVAAVFFQDLPAPASGALCALDLDGVLESSPLGFPGMTQAGAIALRALLLHGYRPVPVTGRSLDEVRERCAAYGLAGGVAEYGAVIYNHGTGHARHLLAERDRGALARLRRTLAETRGISLDPDYRHAVRAYRLDADGRRRGLSREAVARALALSATTRQLRAIPGDEQTDFMALGIDKGTGLRALAEELGVRRSARTGTVAALAVGDTVSDLPMLALATLRRAPGNADRAVRAAAVPVLRRSYQRGLALAVEQLLGHEPGGCAVCRAPRRTPQARLLLAILGAREAGSWGMVRRALRLGMEAAFAGGSHGEDG